MSDSGAHWTIYESPIGPLTLVAGPRGLTDLNFPGRLSGPRRGDEAADARGRPAARRLLRRGAARSSTFPSTSTATPLQQAVWRALLEIPYGETTSYGEQAAKIDPALFATDVEPWQRARVVGAANGRNPIAVVVPCHRVIGADGSLTGYGGGLERKRALLDLERNRQLAIL